MKKLTSIIFCALASFNLSAHGEGIVGLHIHGESTLVLGTNLGYVDSNANVLFKEIAIN